MSVVVLVVRSRVLLSRSLEVLNREVVRQITLKVPIKSVSHRKSLEVLLVGSLEVPFCYEVALFSHPLLVLLLASLLPPFANDFNVLLQSSDYTIFFGAGI